MDLVHLSRQHQKTPGLDNGKRERNHRSSKLSYLTVLMTLVILNLAFSNIIQVVSFARNVVNGPFANIYHNTPEDTGRASIPVVLPTNPVVLSDTVTATVTSDDETADTPITFGSTVAPIVSDSPIPTVYGSLVVILSLAAAQSSRDDDRIVTSGPTATQVEATASFSSKVGGYGTL
ncbi:hypothetical protein NPX13_g5945 [Xylaria arbuscula]|uniref:Transmembrane protein n=1 Tax=Xylaria arbuscula TaxID=114810 RepID=A0A9W8NCS8_9PEZI|nr:hypothetical protein NPX13_g5945 [Xylaria arbuscula]